MQIHNIKRKTLFIQYNNLVWDMYKLMPSLITFNNPWINSFKTNSPDGVAIFI